MVPYHEATLWRYKKIAASPARGGVYGDSAGSQAPISMHLLEKATLRLPKVNRPYDGWVFKDCCRRGSEL